MVHYDEDITLRLFFMRPFVTDNTVLRKERIEPINEEEVLP